MPIIRKVYGPFSREPVGGGEIKWYFHGIRDDYTVASWILTYVISTRKFTAAARPPTEPVGRVMRAVMEHLPKDYHKQVKHTRMFIEGDDSPVEEGRIVDILKKRLKPEDFGRAAALAILRK